MGQLADAQQGNLRALVGQAVQSTGGNGADAVDIGHLRAQSDVSILQSVESHAHAAGGGDVAQMWAEERSLFPLGRTCTPAEAAEAIYFLAVNGTFCTGSLLKVDGGLTAG